MAAEHGLVLVYQALFTNLQRLAFSLLGGLGLLSLLLFLVGQLAFTRPIIFSITLVALLLAIRPLLRTVREYPLAQSSQSLPLLPTAVIAAILLVTAVAGLAQTTGDWNNDAVAYHFLGPRVWLREGLIRPVPDNSLTAFPAMPETLFATLYATLAVIALPMLPARDHPRPAARRLRQLGHPFRADHSPKHSGPPRL